MMLCNLMYDCQEKSKRNEIDWKQLFVRKIVGLFNSTNSHTYILSRHQNLNSCPKVATLFRGLLQSFNLQSYGVVMLKRILHFSTKDYVVMKKYSCVLVWKDTCFQNNEGMLLFLEENCTAQLTEFTNFS